MTNLKIYPSAVVSRYDDFGVRPEMISTRERNENVELVIRRFFVPEDGDLHNLFRESVARSLDPGPEFDGRFEEELEYAEDGFGLELTAPSAAVTQAFREYAHTELGAVALARLIDWDNQFIEKGWRSRDGSLTDEGIEAYGAGMWRPFRVASNGDNPDTVTPSGTLVLPDEFDEEYYSTGDVSNPLAILHHEIKAHVLPLKEAAGLVPGREMELICVRLESEMLEELGLPVRQLNWGKDDGTLDHTLHEQSEQYYHGLVRYDENGSLVEIDPETDTVVGLARLKTPA